MSPAIVNRVAWRGKVGIGERPNSYADTANLAFLGVEEIGSADWTEAKSELGALITGAHVFRGVAKDFVWRGKTRECCENAPRSLLAGKAMADTNNPRLALDFDAKLPAVT